MEERIGREGMREEERIGTGGFRGRRGGPLQVSGEPRPLCLTYTVLSRSLPYSVPRSRGPGAQANTRRTRRTPSDLHSNDALCCLHSHGRSTVFSVNQS